MYTQEDQEMNAKVIAMLHTMIETRELPLAIMRGDVGTSGGNGNYFLISPELYLELVARYDDLVAKRADRIVA